MFGEEADLFLASLSEYGIYVTESGIMLEGEQAEEYKRKKAERERQARQDEGREFNRLKNRAENKLRRYAKEHPDEDLENAAHKTADHIRNNMPRLHQLTSDAGKSAMYDKLAFDGRTTRSTVQAMNKAMNATNSADNKAKREMKKPADKRDKRFTQESTMFDNIDFI